MFRIKHIKSTLTIASKAKANSSVLFNQQSFNYHVTNKAQNDLIVGGLAVAGSAMALQYVLKAYENFSKNKPAEPETPQEQQDKNKEESASSSTTTQKKQEKKTQATNASVSAFETWFAKNFYDGGFEEKMSKREAALILGVRESASAERIKEAHRRILLLNHPDRGGSAFISAKVNEAKDLLLKGKN